MSKRVFHVDVTNHNKNCYHSKEIGFKSCFFKMFSQFFTISSIFLIFSWSRFFGFASKYFMTAVEVWRGRVKSRPFSTAAFRFSYVVLPTVLALAYLYQSFNSISPSSFPDLSKTRLMGVSSDFRAFSYLIDVKASKFESGSSFFSKPVSNWSAFQRIARFAILRLLKITIVDTFIVFHQVTICFSQ